MQIEELLPPQQIPNLYLFQKIFSYLPRTSQIKLLKSIPQYQILIKDLSESENHILVYTQSLVWHEKFYPTLPKLSLSDPSICSNSFIIGGTSQMSEIGAYSVAIGRSPAYSVAIGRSPVFEEYSTSFGSDKKWGFYASNAIGSGKCDIPDRPNSKNIVSHVSNLKINQSEYSRFENSSITGSNITINIEPFVVVRHLIIHGHDLDITFTSHKIYHNHTLQGCQQRLIF